MTWSVTFMWGIQRSPIIPSLSSSWVSFWASSRVAGDLVDIAVHVTSLLWNKKSNFRKNCSVSLPSDLILFKIKRTIQPPHCVKDGHLNVLHITGRDIYDKNDVQYSERITLSRLIHQQSLRGFTSDLIMMIKCHANISDGMMLKK